MPAPVIRFTLDPTGVNPNNLVINENHTLDARVQVRAVAPIYGAFYQNSLVIKDTSTNTQLTSTQFSCVELLQDPTMRFGQGVYALILITDKTVSNTVSINYQVVGGDYQNSAETVVAAYQALIGDNRPVDWANVLNKPVSYPPSLHEHLLSDVYGFQSIVASLERIRNAIVLSDVPTLEAVLNWAWNNWGELQNLPLMTQADADSGVPSKKYVTFDMLLYLLDIYKGGSRITSYVSTKSLAQGYAVNVLVNTFDYANDTRLYWTLSHLSTTPSDFSATAGSFSINQNTGSLTVQLSGTVPTLGTELFRIQIRKGSPQGQVIALTDAITIGYQQDISKVTAQLMFEESIYSPQIQITPATMFWLQQ